VLKAVLFVAGSAGLAVILQWALVFGLKNYNTSARGVWNRVLRGEVNADILVCGSSRALVHYDPDVIDRIVGKTVYNIGQNGTLPDLQLSVLKTYLSHNRSPLCIVVNIDNSCFTTTKEVYDPQRYIPYLGEPDLYKTLVSIDSRFARMRSFPLVGVIEHRLFLTALAGLLGVTAKEDHFLGYKPTDLHWTGEFDKFKAKHPTGVAIEMEECKVPALAELIECGLRAKARVVLVYSPEYHGGQKLFRNRSEVLARVREIADLYGVEFWDFSDDPSCRDKSLFYNSQHLNRRGATLFSRIVAHRLNDLQATNPLRQSVW
jgi:hypothetical protein